MRAAGAALSRDATAPEAFCRGLRGPDPAVGSRVTHRCHARWSSPAATDVGDLSGRASAGLGYLPRQGPHFSATVPRCRTEQFERADDREVEPLGEHPDRALDRHSRVERELELAHRLLELPDLPLACI